MQSNLQTKVEISGLKLIYLTCKQCTGTKCIPYCSIYFNKVLDIKRNSFWHLKMKCFIIKPTSPVNIALVLKAKEKNSTL